jgi:hypothetical protein
MSKYSKKWTISPETQSEALTIAKGRQQPGQTKEQTRFIAKGIQKGIEQYKKQQKAKARELDKRLKTVQLKTSAVGEIKVQERIATGSIGCLGHC